jgi:hypothetical protein
LYASPEGRDDPCPGWRERFFTAPAIIELGQPMPGTTGDEEYHELLLEMNRRYATGDESSMEVEVEGRLVRKWLLFINRHSDGGYIGNGFGQNGGRAAVLQIKSLRKVGGARNTGNR